MTPDDIAQLLRSEIRYLRASKEPVPGDMREAMADRLEMALAGLPSLQTGLPMSEHSVSMSDNMQIAPNRSVNRRPGSKTSPELDAIAATGWSLRQLAAAIKERNNVPPKQQFSHVHLRDVLMGHKGTLTAELKREIRAITKAKV